MATQKQKIPKGQRNLELIIKLATIFFIFSIFYPKVGSSDYMDNVFMNSMLNLGKLVIFIALGVLVLALKRELFFIIGMLIVVIGSAYLVVVRMFETGFDPALSVYVLVALLAYHFVQKNERRVRKGRR